MPSFQDSAIIVVIALLLFGPKGMAKLARELGKLMGEFRRASADFRSQMDEEFRISEQAEQQQKIAAMEAAAPVTPPFPAEPIPEPEHPHTPVYPEQTAQVEKTAETAPLASEPAIPEHRIDSRPEPAAAPAPEPLPIATAGDLRMMPPATGLPVPRAPRSAPEPTPVHSETHGLSGLFDSIPAVNSDEREPSEAASRG